MFYTNVFQRGNRIFYRGIENGERVNKKISYRPTLFLPSKEETKYKTLLGKYVYPIEFESIATAKKFVREYDEVDNFNFYGNTQFHYCYIADNFPEKVEYNFDNLIIANIDIEVASDDGFPEPSRAEHPIVAITNKVGNKYYVFGCGDYSSEDKNIHYFKCRDEAHLLTKFLEHWNHIECDIVTGWNIAFFDIPYLYRRIENIFGEEDANKLSPWNVVTNRMVNIFNKMHCVYELGGISTLDYLEMYRKYSPKTENYKLNTIAHIELGEKKLDYSEHESLFGLYKKDFQKFIEYNIKDVQLVDAIDQKLQYISMVCAIAYDAKVNFTDVFTQVRMWDTIVFNFLKKRNIVLPQKFTKSKDEKYEGAYVKEPLIGFHNWVVSFDLNSLYPNLISEFNISTETLVPEKYRPITEENIIDEQVNLSDLHDDNLTMACNGHCFRRDVEGFFPEILMRMYEDRKAYKKKMIDAKLKLEKINAELEKRGLL